MIIFPMAGLSARFTSAGYKLPKYMLPLNGKSMFASSVSGFAERFAAEPFLFICRDTFDTLEFVEREISQMKEGPRSYQIIVLENETSGQADTVYQGLQRAGVSNETPLTIFNIDTHRSHYQLPEQFDLKKIDGYLEMFRGEGEHWSFVAPAEEQSGTHGTVAFVAEKDRISNLCSSGLYYFRRAGLFRKLFEATLTEHPEELQGGERYIAPLYNSAIAQGCDIRYIVVPQDIFTLTGTPEEYEAFRRWERTD